jgi:hypothetical protein
MANRAYFRLVSETVKQNALNTLQAVETPSKNAKGELMFAPMIVEIRPQKRSEAQNDKMHAMLRDIAKQMSFNGGKLSVEQWKHILVIAFDKVMKDEDPLIVEFMGMPISLRRSTAGMGVGEIADFIEFLTAWGVENGVRFSDQADYWGIR